MKKTNNKVLIVVVVVLLNVLVLYMIGQSLLGKASQYDKVVAEARGYVEKELCSKAIDKYNEAVIMKDSLELRMEMLDVYAKGIDIGEITSTYDVFTSVTTMVDTYADDAIVYEKACEMLVKYNRYEECANILMKARDLRVSSDIIEQYREQVRYQYTKYFAMYTDVLPAFNDVYTVSADGVYTFLSNEASPDYDGAYTFATSFSEGYAFVKAMHPDGSEKSFVINKNEQRQAYFDGVETSSGVGAAKDKDGDQVLLLACKVGDKYKYYNVNGEEAFGDYAFAGRFRNDVAAVMESEGNWKLINGTGNVITDKTFTDVVLNEFDECAPKGLILAKEGDKYHIYNLKGEQISDFACDGAKAFIDDYAAFKSGDQWGFVDTEGQIVLEAQYDDAKSFSNKMGAVQIGGVWSLINPKGEIVIQETFEDVDYLNEKGVCFVKSEGYWSYLKMFYTGK